MISFLRFLIVLLALGYLWGGAALLWGLAIYFTYFCASEASTVPLTLGGLLYLAAALYGSAMVFDDLGSELHRK